MYTGLFYIVGRGKEPWTFKHEVLGTLFYTWEFYDDLQRYKKQVLQVGFVKCSAKIEKKLNKFRTLVSEVLFCVSNPVYNELREN